MNKKFVFINLSIKSGYTSGENHGIAHLIPIVRKHLYEIALLNIRSEITCKEFRNKIDKINPSIVGFSCISHQFKYLIKYSKELEGYSRILQIAGGPGPTLDPEGVLSKSAIKGVCIGEGEIPLDNLLNNIERGEDIFNTKSFCWRINGGIKKNSVRQFVPDLSTLDFPDYSLFSRDVVVSHGSLLMTLSRGCPYDCHYCCNAALRSLYPSSKGYFRIPSVEHSIELLEGMVRQYPETKFIIFEDDLLIANKAWFEGFAAEYLKRINLPYSTDVRAEHVTPDIIKALKHSGCKRILLGLESGNEYIRNTVLNRKHNNSLIIEKSKMIKDAGIPLFTFNIVGLPFESGKQMEDTFKLNLEIKPNHGVCTFFYPYKGTVLYDICKQKNLLKSADELFEITNYNTKPCIKMAAATEKDCLYFQKKMSHYFGIRCELTKIAYLPLPVGIKKVLALVWYWIKTILKKNPFTYTIFKKLREKSG